MIPLTAVTLMTITSEGNFSDTKIYVDLQKKYHINSIASTAGDRADAAELPAGEAAEAVWAGQGHAAQQAGCHASRQ